MANLKFFAADIEATGLLVHLEEQGDEARLHNFCAINIQDKDFKDIHMFHPHNKKSKEELQKFIEDESHVFIMHNAYSYDLHALEFFGFDVSKMKIIDTLPLSWYLHHDRERHGLEWWGVDFGIEKPAVEDWLGLSQEEYDHRVVEDCKIQRKLWMRLCTQYGELYNQKTQVDVYKHPAFNYIQFKAKQLSEQLKNKWKLDVEGAENLKETLGGEVDERTKILASVMPKVPKKAKRKPPAKPFLQNGELSATGRRWKELCDKNGFDHLIYKGVIEEVTGYEEPNPASSKQKKDWLFSLGWEPETFEYKREGDQIRKIPQINIKNSGGLVCPSITRLAEDVPEVKALEGLGIVNHRFSMVKGWLNSHEKGYLSAEANGFTNTLRLKHRNIVNVPSGRVPWGKELRSLLLAREGCIITGADLSSLENRWKFHHQYPLDPKFVESQMSDDFDPHLELAVAGGLLTENEMNFYKLFESGFSLPEKAYTDEFKVLLFKAEQDTSWKESEIKRIAKIRGMGKNANYACLPMDTEVLTESGFKFFKDLNVGDVVYSYKGGNIIPDTIKFKHFYSDALVVDMSDTKKSVRCTLDHRWVTSQRGDKISFKALDEFNTETKILATAPYVGGKSHISEDEAELIAWILSDGSTSGRVTIAQSLNKFYKDVESCLDRLGLSYNKSTSSRENGNDVYVYTIYQKELKVLFSRVLGRECLDKHDYNWSEWVLKLNYNSLKSFVETFWKADGYNTCKDSFVIKQNEGAIADGVALAMYLLGDGRVKFEGDGKCKVLRKHKSKFIGFQRKAVKSVNLEDVFCLTTENGSFVIKQGGELMLTGNCQYGSGVETLSRTAKITIRQAKKLKAGYDKLNWTIPVIAKKQRVESFSFGKFLFNKQNNIWYPLKAEKDRFSTLIQGSGSYTLDLWIMKFFGIRKKAVENGRIKFVNLLATFHDELILEHLEEDAEEVKLMLQEAMVLVNKSLKLSVELSCDIKQGKNYYEIH